MSTSMVIPDLPAHLQAGTEAARARNLAAMGGIKAGGFPRISQGGGKFHLVEGDQKTLITDPNNPELPSMQLEVVVVGFNPMISKTFYAGKWEPGDAEEPDCSADNGTVPDAGVPKPQSTNCANCPQNVWGSKISEHNGKQIKACSDNKRLVIVRADDIAGSPAISLTITPGALREWAEYVKALDSKGIEISTVVTKVQFDPTVTFPKLVFKFGRYLDVAEIAAVRIREAGEDVRMIASPKTPALAGTIVPATQAAAPALAPAAPALAPAAPAPAPAQIKPVVEASWKDGIPANIVAAIEAVGGPESAAGVTLVAQFKPAAAAAAVEEEEEDEPPVDPFAGLPPHVKLAVDGAGGIDSVGGQAVYSALGGSAVLTAPGTEKPAPKKRKRRTKEQIAADEAATAAQAPAPIAAAPAAASLATPPAATLGSDLDALLASAMATPTPAA